MIARTACSARALPRCGVALVALLALISCAIPPPEEARRPLPGENPFLSDLGAGEQRSLYLEDRSCGSGRSAIRYTLWRPHGAPRQVLVYNHGLQSHRGWFFATGAELAERGYAVYAFDRIGSGESDAGAARVHGEPVRLRGHIPDWQCFVDTLDAVVVLAHGEFPDSEVFLWGNSYGAKVVTAYLLVHREELGARGIRGAVFTVPGLFANEASMPLPFSRLRLLLSADTTYFPVPMVAHENDNGASWFVGPGMWDERIREDGLSLRRLTRRFYLETREMDRFVSGQPAEVRLPVPGLYLLVRGDRMMDNPRLERYLIRHAGDAWVKYYAGGPEGKHFLLYTQDREQALADIESFLRGDAAAIAGAVHYGSGF